ncbi:MAG: hypothetical protein AB7K52_02625 [Phycisphaerales bacterium]
MRSLIAMTVGEYLPPSEGDGPSMEMDGPGLMKWARERFGVELTEADLNASRGMSELRRSIVDRLYDAGSQQIEAIDLSGMGAYLEPRYGAEQLCAWAKNKFDIEIDPAKVAAAKGEGLEKVEALILSEAERLYLKREVEFPVDFIIDLTKMLAQQSAAGAMQQLVSWANSRYRLGWTAEYVSKTLLSPARTREELIKASEKFVKEGTLEKEVQAAIACATDEALAAHLKERFNVEMPEHMRFLDGVERSNAVRSKVESILRAELLYLERTMLLEVLDDLWKGHLNQMDQLQDSISFRAFSQRDPRYEFKREGAALMNQTLEDIRDRVTDYIFKVKLSPAAPAPAPGSMPAAGARGARPAGAPAAGPAKADPYYTPPKR